jgi:hypothetical protein
MRPSPARPRRRSVRARQAQCTPSGAGDLDLHHAGSRRHFGAHAGGARLEGAAGQPPQSGDGGFRGGGWGASAAAERRRVAAQRESFAPGLGPRVPRAHINPPQARCTPPLSIDKWLCSRTCPLSIDKCLRSRSAGTTTRPPWAARRRAAARCSSGRRASRRASATCGESPRCGSR